MVITKEFIWLHFGKTAGTSFRNSLCQLFPDSFSAPDNQPWKHANIKIAKRFGVTIKTDLPFACGFRRLGSWAESHLNQQFGDNIPEEARQATIRGRLYLAPSSLARKAKIFQGVKTLDDLLRYYYEDTLPFLLRQEFLVQDFICFYNHIGGVIVGSGQIEEAFKIKLNIGSYKRGSIFNSSELAYLYSSCPFWSELERQLYPPNLY